MTEKERLLKNLSIKQSMKDTHKKRKQQVCRVYKIKIDESSLSSIQKEQIKMMFVEAKWIWNDILNWEEQNKDKSAWDYKIEKTVNVKTKDGTIEKRELKYIHSQMRSEERR